MSLIEVRDTKLNVDSIANKADSETYFLHGNLASNTWWQPTVEYWSQTGSKSLHLFEWRGCGKSLPAENLQQLEIDELAKDFLALIKQNKHTNINVVGHSTGGLIAMAAIIQEPELFNKVVLLDSVGAKGFELKPEMLQAFTQMKADKEVCAQVMAITIKNVDIESATFNQMVEDAFNVGDLNWEGIPKAITKVDYTEPLKKLKQDFLILHGKEDPVLPIEDSKELAELLPNSKFVALENYGHSLNIENPKLFVKYLNEFL